jgi:hypothetical protein
LQLLDQLEAALQRTQPPPQDVHWFELSHARGLVYEQFGMLEEAIRQLEMEKDAAGEHAFDVQRVRAKMAARDE